MTFKRRGGRKEIILPEGVDDVESSRSPAQDALVVALARAHRRQGLLDTGQVASINELAKKQNVGPSYVGRHLRLTLLAPDIVEAILAGTEPSGLSLAKLAKPFPPRWDEQREHFGFPLPEQATR